MKVKLAIIYGIVIWVLITIFSSVFNPIFTDNLPRVNIIIPLAIIIVTGFFGILYIRSIETNEVVEGILVGIVFIIIDFILDLFVFILPNNTICTGLSFAFVLYDCYNITDYNIIGISCANEHRFKIRRKKYDTKITSSL